MNDQYAIIEYFRALLQDVIDRCGVVAENGTGTIPEFPAYSVDQVTVFSRCQIFLDPETSFALVGEIENDVLPSTPIFVIELAETVPTVNSNAGTLVYGENGFTITVIASKEGRAFLVYKKEVVDLVNMIQAVFAYQRGKRITIGRTTWSDMLGELRASGAVMEIRTSINSYDYTVS